MAKENGEDVGKKKLAATRLHRKIIKIRRRPELRFDSWEGYQKGYSIIEVRYFFFLPL